jgi:hypothetical protein
MKKGFVSERTEEGRKRSPFRPTFSPSGPLTPLTPPSPKLPTKTFFFCFLFFLFSPTASSSKYCFLVVGS